MDKARLITRLLYTVVLAESWCHAEEKPGRSYLLSGCMCRDRLVQLEWRSSPACPAPALSWQSGAAPQRSSALGRPRSHPAHLVSRPPLAPAGIITLCCCTTCPAQRDQGCAALPDMCPVHLQEAWYRTCHLQLLYSSLLAHITWLPRTRLGSAKGVCWRADQDICLAAPGQMYASKLLW